MRFRPKPTLRTPTDILYTHRLRTLVTDAVEVMGKADAKPGMFVLGLRLRDIGVRISNAILLRSRFCAGVSKTVRPSAVDVAGQLRDTSS